VQGIDMSIDKSRIGNDRRERSTSSRDQDSSWKTNRRETHIDHRSEDNTSDGTRVCIQDLIKI
jgi:hypothetical protein